MNPPLCVALNFPNFHTKLPFCYPQGSPDTSVPSILIMPKLASPEVCVNQEYHIISRTEVAACASCWAACLHISYQTAIHPSCAQHSSPLFLHSGKAKKPQDSNIYSMIFAGFQLLLGEGLNKPKQHARAESAKGLFTNLHTSSHQGV